MGFPVTVGGVTYTLDDFSPYGHSDALPNSIQSMGDEYLRPATGSSTTSLTIGTGSRSFTAQTGRNWAVGVTILRLYNSSSNWMEGLVTAYDASTGAATINSVASAGSGTYTSWVINELLGTDVTTMPRGVHSYLDGGVGGMFQDFTAMSCLFHEFQPRHGMMTIWEDFNFDFTFGTDSIENWIPYSNIGSFSAVKNDSFCQAQAGTAHYGIVGLFVENAKEEISMSYGSGGFMSVAESGDFLMVTQVYIPTLSTSTDRFQVRAGLRCTKSSQAGTIFDAGGIGFEYSDNINNGFWTVVYNDGQSREYRSSAYPGITVAAATWYTLAVYGNKKNNTLYFKVITGVNVGTVSVETAVLDSSWAFQASISSWPTDNKYFVHPCFTINKLSGTAQRYMYVDYMWLSKALSGVR